MHPTGNSLPLIVNLSHDAVVSRRVIGGVRRYSNSEIGGQMNTTQVVVTVLVAMSGWAATHFLAMRHTLKMERRKSRVEFLIKTYKKITELRVFAEEQDSESIARFLCDISTDIELQGTKTQTELIAKATSDMLQNGSLTTLDKLAQDLLDDLRGNMKLAKVERQASIFGYTRKTTHKSNQ
jgi:hypothetical protein